MSHSMGEFKFGHLGYWGGERFRALNDLPNQFSWLQHPEGQTGTTSLSLGGRDSSSGRVVSLVMRWRITFLLCIGASWRLMLRALF